MPISDPRDEFFYPTLTLMMDPYNGMFCLFVCFVALHPKSTAMVMAGRSVHVTTLFPGQA